MAAFGGKEHVTVSLKAGSLPQARHLLWGHLKDFDRMLADARALPDPTLPGLGKPGVRRVPEREEMDAVVRAWLRTQEAQVAWQRLNMSLIRVCSPMRISPRTMLALMQRCLKR